MNPLTRWVKKIIQFFRPTKAPEPVRQPEPVAPSSASTHAFPLPETKIPALIEKPSVPPVSESSITASAETTGQTAPPKPETFPVAAPGPATVQPASPVLPKPERKPVPEISPATPAVEPSTLSVPEPAAATSEVKFAPEVPPAISTGKVSATNFVAEPVKSRIEPATQTTAPKQEISEVAVAVPTTDRSKEESPQDELRRKAAALVHKSTKPAHTEPVITEKTPEPVAQPTEKIIAIEPALVPRHQTIPVAEIKVSSPEPAPAAKPEPVLAPASPTSEPTPQRESKPEPKKEESKSARKPVFTGQLDYALESVRSILDKPARLRHLEGMLSVHEIANRELLDLVPYEPGKPVDDVARELGLDPASIIKLASNENPLGPSPLAMEAMHDAVAKVHFYPDGGGFHLRNAIAHSFGLGRENVVLGNGSNEIIELLFHTFTRPGIHEIVTSRHAFAVYTLMAQLFGVHAIEVDDVDFTSDLNAMLKAITPQTRLVFLASPNNPTGTRVSNEALDHFLRDLPAHVIAVLDEAYYEFLDNPPDTVGHVRKGSRVVLMRTFSKIQGLAGLRIGYGLAPAELADLLQRARQPFNANAIAQAGAMAGLADVEHQRKTKAITDEGRKLLEETFAKMSLKYVPSSANFVLVHVGDGGEVFKRLMKKGIIVRSMVSYHLPEYIRVSVGTPEQNARFLAELPATLEGLTAFNR